ncbi:MAG TPA: alpha/beta hydrolase [Crinalium sp.]
MTADIDASTAPLDHRLELAQAVYLERCAPGYRTRRVRWSGGSTQVIELGEGPALLLVHGGMGEALQYGSILPLLARRYRVIAVDRPGNGLADPFDYRGVDMLAHARRFLSELIDAEGLSSVPIVASSMGGLWSIVFAIESPERVPRLVLLGAPAGIRRKVPLQIRLGTLPILKTLVRSMMTSPTRDSTLAFWSQLMVAHPERLDVDLLDALTASQSRNASSWFSLIDSTIDVGGMKPELMIGERWKKLSVPTTLILGENDAWCPLEEGEAIVLSNPHVQVVRKVVRIPSAGHAAWLDDPGRVVDAINKALIEI